MLDDYPWNPDGWWASTIDVRSGRPKEPLAKPSIVNKNAVMAMAAGMVGQYVRGIDPALSARLRAKADRCAYRQIIPAQEADGYWHYSLGGNDPKDKDVLGYFMLTTNALIQLQRLTGSYDDPAFQAALDRACAFAAARIAPMTAPNHGPPPPADRATPATPARYEPGDGPKRGFALGPILFAGGHAREGVKVIDHWMARFPYGDGGQDGAHAAHPAALVLVLLRPAAGEATR